jgi:hypothetical protein
VPGQLNVGEFRLILAVALHWSPQVEYDQIDGLLSRWSGLAKAAVQVQLTAIAYILKRGLTIIAAV